MIRATSGLTAHTIADNNNYIIRTSIYLDTPPKTYQTFSDIGTLTGEAGFLLRFAIRNSGYRATR
jgi:hypothetical protein